MAGVAAALPDSVQRAPERLASRRVVAVGDDPGDVVMAVDAYVTKFPYIEHLGPIWHALPLERRGRVYVADGYDVFLARACTLGLPIAKGRPPFHPADDPVIILGGSDLQPGYSSRPVIFAEHGAGQTYAGLDSVGYSGGIGRDMVRLFLTPSQRVADLNLARYPAADAVAIGDPTIVGPFGMPDRPVAVGISFHWDGAGIAPEAATTWPFWRDAVERYVHNGRFPVIGHSHPRYAHKLAPWWEGLGIEYVARFADLVKRASVYACDNSSTLYEWGSCNRPVIVLDSPRYRRDVEHGLRFWSEADVGVRISDPAELTEAIELAVADPPEVAARRRAIVARVYAATGAESAERAATAIVARWP